MCKSVGYALSFSYSVVASHCDGPRSRVANYPSLYLPFARATHRAGAGKIVSADTEVVIEGFTRCANTFAVLAFQSAQSRPVRLAHHLHAPAQFVAAARRHIPALLLVRSPEPTVLSTVIRQPFLSMRQVLSAYKKFHETLFRYRSGFVLATFDEVVRDFGQVTDRVNRRFGTEFAVFTHSEENVQRVFWLIKERSRMGPAGPDLAAFQSGYIGLADLERHLALRTPSSDPDWLESVVPRPSSSRVEEKARLKHVYRSPKLTGLRLGAERACGRLVGAGRSLSG